MSSCDFELAPEVVDQQRNLADSPFIESPEQNQRQSKSMIQPKKVKVLSKSFLTKKAIQNLNSVNQLGQGKISVSKRKIS